MSIFRGDPELLRRFRAGDRAVLGQVYDAYAERVSLLVRRGCHLQTAAGADSGLRVSGDDFLDVVQEVFVKAFAPAARQSYDGVRDFGPYLLMIARNVMIDEFRRRGATVPLPPEMFAVMPSEEASLEERAPWEDAERLSVVERFIASLPPDLARVHRHRYVEGHTQQATAQAMGISRQNLRTLEARLHQGLAEVFARGREQADRQPKPTEARSVRVQGTSDG
jgi:RNA polymerase sigma-70 factor (ECF subfamily)